MSVLKSASRTVTTALDTITNTFDSATKVVAVMNNKAQLYYEHSVDVDTENSALNTLEELDAIQDALGNDNEKWDRFEKIMERRQKTTLLIRPTP